jgi:MFS family permease
MAVEPKRVSTNNAVKPDNQFPFWLLYAMAMPATVSTLFLASLLPTVLNDLGFKLTFGGLSLTMFGLGGTVGMFVWIAIAHRKGELPCSIVAFFLSVPLLVAYLIFIDNKMAIWLLFGLGSCSISAYILMITLARGATGPNLGRRMGFIAGGTWALANIVFLAFLPAAQYFGPEVILKFTPVGYVLSAVFGLFIMFRARRQAGEKLAGE